MIRKPFFRTWRSRIKRKYLIGSLEVLREAVIIFRDQQLRLKLLSMSIYISWGDSGDGRLGLGDIKEELRMVDSIE